MAWNNVTRVLFEPTQNGASEMYLDDIKITK